jgi:hypothetical protein
MSWSDVSPTEAVAFAIFIVMTVGFFAWVAALWLRK